MLCQWRKSAFQLRETDEVNPFITHGLHEAGGHEQLEVLLPPLITLRAGVHHQFRNSGGEFLQREREERIDEMMRIYNSLFAEHIFHPLCRLCSEKNILSAQQGIPLFTESDSLYPMPAHCFNKGFKYLGEAVDVMVGINMGGDQS